jgi:inositol 3-alpha-galactosyltransferase
MQRDDIKMLVKKWWDIYNDSSLDYNKNLSGNDEAQTNGVENEPFVQALCEVGRVQYVTAPSAA